MSIPLTAATVLKDHVTQYYKLNRGLRGETTINDLRDFGLGRRLSNLAAARAVGFAANRRLLTVPRLSHDCALGEATVQAITRPAVIAGRRVPALRFEDPRVRALLSGLVLFRLLAGGFTHAEFRAHLAPLLDWRPEALPRGRVTYDLRRLRLRRQGP